MIFAGVLNMLLIASYTLDADELRQANLTGNFMLILFKDVIAILHAPTLTNTTYTDSET